MSNSVVCPFQKNSRACAPVQSTASTAASTAGRAMVTVKEGGREREGEMGGKKGQSGEMGKWQTPSATSRNVFFLPQSQSVALCAPVACGLWLEPQGARLAQCMRRALEWRTAWREKAGKERLFLRKERFFMRLSFSVSVRSLLCSLLQRPCEQKCSSDRCAIIAPPSLLIQNCPSSTDGEPCLDQPSSCTY